MGGVSGQCVNPHGLRVDVLDTYHLTEWDKKIETTILERDRLIEKASSYEKAQEIKRIYNHRIEMFLEKKIKELDKNTKDIDAKIKLCEIELSYISSKLFRQEHYSFEIELMRNFFLKRIELLRAEKDKKNDESSGGKQPNF